MYLLAELNLLRVDSRAFHHPLQILKLGAPEMHLQELLTDSYVHQEVSKTWRDNLTNSHAH